MEKHAVLVGLVGTNLQFSMARQIHMTGGDQNGLRYVYRLIDLADAVAECSFLSTLRETYAEIISAYVSINIARCDPNGSRAPAIQSFRHFSPVSETRHSCSEPTHE